MLSNILKLEGAKSLSKDQQKSITGGSPCCNPAFECCTFPGGGPCGGCTGCQFCHSNTGPQCGCL